MLSVDDVLEIIDWVENFDQKNIQVAFLGTPVRSGSHLLHSLLDHHPQVLQLPIPFYYYFDWEFSFQAEAPESLVDAFFSRSTTLFPYITKLGANQDITIDLHFDILAQLMKVILKRLKTVNRKTFFLLFHFVYGKYQGMDLKNVKVLLQHHHAVPHGVSYFAFKASHQYYMDLEELKSLLSTSPQQYREMGDPVIQNVLADFPDAKLLIPIRQPMATLHSGISVYQKSEIHPELGLAVLVYYMCLLGYYNLFPLQQYLGERCKLVKFEDLHGQTESTMRDIATFLGIEFNATLLNSTFGGQPWYIPRGSGKWVCGTDPTIPANDTAWQKAWSPETQAFYATLCAPLYPAFGYPLELDETYLETDPGELLEWFPEEQALYDAYPTFLTKLSEQIIEETRSRPPSDRLEQVLEEQASLLEQKVEFYVNYPKIRQLLLHYFSQAKQDILYQISRTDG